MDDAKSAFVQGQDGERSGADNEVAAARHLTDG